MPGHSQGTKNGRKAQDKACLTFKSKMGEIPASPIAILNRLLNQINSFSYELVSMCLVNQPLSTADHGLTKIFKSEKDP